MHPRSPASFGSKMKFLKKVGFILLLLFISHDTLAQSFTLPGDGKWYRVANFGGRHAHFEYIYAHGTGNNPSLATGTITFINARNLLVQHHQTMGYQAWNEPQFALINFGGNSEVWVRATAGVDAAPFTIKYSLGSYLTLGDISDSDLADNGGTLTIYDKLRDDATTIYQDLKIPAGNVSIGTSEDHGYKLAVNGSIRAKAITLEASPWPDFVFEPGYRVTPLESLETYLRKEKHLPGIASAPEVLEHGIELGQMNAKLLEKIEELTLYLIDHHKTVKRLERHIKVLEHKVRVIGRSHH